MSQNVVLLGEFHPIVPGAGADPRELSLHPIQFLALSCEMVITDGTRVNLMGNDLLNQRYIADNRNSHSLRAYSNVHSYDSYRNAEKKRPRGIARLRQFGKKILNLLTNPQTEELDIEQPPREAVVFKFPSHVLRLDGVNKEAA